MRIGLIDGRDFRIGDQRARLDKTAKPVAGVGIVSEAFTRAWFDGRDPIGQVISVRQSKDQSAPMEIIGYVRDAAYLNLREPLSATVYVPSGLREHNAFLVRTAGDPLSQAPALRNAVSRTRSDFRVRSIETQDGYVQWHLIRERLLAALSVFFAVVVVVLASLGLYGVLNYSVTQQRREIGIRMALGARPAHVLQTVAADVFVMVGAGSLAGVAAGVISARFVESFLFEVRASDLAIMTTPVAILICVALISGFQPAIRSVRIDPAQTLRAD